MSWPGFAAVAAAFFLTHSLPVRPGVKAWLVARLGARGFGLGYGGLSLVMLGALIHAAGAAPHVPLWPMLPWQVAVVQAGMLGVCLILGFAIARPNPFSFGGAGNARFDPARPGIVRWCRHPVLVALGLWAGLHLLANGDLAHVLLFGVLGLFAFAGTGLVDRRRRREMGAREWARLRAAVAAGPRIPVPVSWLGVVLRAGAALLLYAVLIRLHPVVIGPAVV